MENTSIPEHTSLLERVPPNLVQSIRAFRPVDLQEEAIQLQQHFLYAHCAQALTRQQILALVAESFFIPKNFARNGEALYAALTEMLHQTGPQPGFLIVLEHLPNTPKFDKEAREILLDAFRDAADYWAEKSVPFRVFYSFE